MRTLTLARFTFQEARRKRVIIGAVALTAVFVALFAFGAHLAFADADRIVRGVSLRERMAPAVLWVGLYAVNFMGGLLAIFAAVGAVSAELEYGTLTAIVTKPVHRWEIIVGKWLGYGAMLAAYIFLTGGAILTIIAYEGRYTVAQPGLVLVLLTLESLLLLGLTLLGSTLLSAIANGIVLLILYAIALVGGMVEQFGSLFDNQTMINIGILTSLAMPSDVLWKFASYLSQPPVTGLQLTQFLGPFAVLNPPSMAMVVYAGLYTLAALAAASTVFSRRDL